MFNLINITACYASSGEIYSDTIFVHHISSPVMVNTYKISRKEDFLQGEFQQLRTFLKHVLSLRSLTRMTTEFYFLPLRSAKGSCIERDQFSLF